MLKEMLPAIYRSKIGDEPTDAEKLLDAFEPVMAEIREDIRVFPKIISPEQCPEAFLDKLLFMAGWGLNLELTVSQKRKVAASIARIHKQQGTDEGIKNLTRLLLGFETLIIPAERDTANRRSYYTFHVQPVVPQRDFTEAEAAQVMAIVEYMKPAHTHCVLIGPGDDWTLGISELDVSTYLH